MMHYLNNQEKKRSEGLWAEVFTEDSAKFREYYYREKIRDNKILAIEKEGEIVSMLHRNPYLIKAGGECWKCDYIVGVSTAQKYRNRGYMRRLMERALADMRREHMAFTFLMPVSEGLYRAFGFSYIYAKSETLLNERGVLELEKKTCKEADVEMTARCMNQVLEKKYEMYALRDIDYVKRLRQEVESEAGILELLFDNGEAVGVRGYWGSPKREQRLLLCEQGYVWEKEAKTPCIMGRIVDVQKFVRVIRLRKEVREEEMCLLLWLEDGQIRQNAGYWRWHIDKRTSRLERVENAEKRADIALDIADFSAWLTGYACPQEAEPYRKFIRPLQGVFLDEVV